MIITVKFLRNQFKYSPKGGYFFYLNSLQPTGFRGIVTEARPADDEAKFSGSPKSPKGFLGRRKHNEAVSFSVRKTISGVRADEAQRSKSLGAPSRQAILGTARAKSQVRVSIPSVKIFYFAGSLIRGAISWIIDVV